MKKANPLLAAVHADNAARSADSKNRHHHLWACTQETFYMLPTEMRPEFLLKGIPSSSKIDGYKSKWIPKLADQRKAEFSENVNKILSEGEIIVKQTSTR